MKKTKKQKTKKENKKTKSTTKKKKEVTTENTSENFVSKLEKTSVEKTKKELKEEDFQSKLEVKRIKHLRKEELYRLKKEFKARILSAKTKKERKQINREYKNAFKKGIFTHTPGYIIEVEKVFKYFYNKKRYEKALDNVSLKIKTGDLVVILGASGSGKSTLLNVLSGLTSADAGKVLVAEHDLFRLNEKEKTKFRKDNISFIFQSYNLIQSLTVLENIKVGANLRNKKDKSMDINDVIKKLGLWNQRNKYPYQLSGGQQQRISIARALTKNPKVLFADEPTGALDEITGRETLELISYINRTFKTTIILVTHNPNIAQIADTIIRVKDGKISSIEENKNKIKVSKINWA